MMNMSKIHSYNELALRINQLTGLKDAQEIALKNDVKELDLSGFSF